MARKSTEYVEEPYDENGTIGDLRLLVREIEKLQLMGNRQIITEARDALCEVLLKSAERLKEKYR
jgi:hypothetical protein